LVVLYSWGYNSFLIYSIFYSLQDGSRIGISGTATFDAIFQRIIVKFVPTRVAKFGK